MLRSGQAQVRSFRVIPNVPEPLAPLLELAHNLWWTWHPEAVDLFRRLDRDLWEQSGHNPVKLLGRLSQSVLNRAADDRSYLHAVSMVHARFRQHLERLSWFQRTCPELCNESGGKPLRVAYFSAEFGLTECFQIYSGGLGLLAGDHLKSASELGLPLCGVGLLYRCGYFHQYLSADGWQQETYPDLDFPNQPVRRLIDPQTGEQYRVTVELPGREVTIGVWQATIGRVPLYLLDTNFPENRREDRDITRTLYGGDVETRIQQEIILGIGGVRALEKIGEPVTAYHINEGHAAFLALERISRLRELHNTSFDVALRAAASGHLFTTHTPVPAGIDRFSPQLVERYFQPMLGRLGADMNGLLGIGRGNPFDNNEYFSMAVLALRTSNYCNGVSRLHGEVSRAMWRDLYPGVPEPEVPIGHVTNGVHPRSWIAPALGRLFDRYLGPEWQLDPTDFGIWKAVNDIPDEELWRQRKRQREKLITWCRGRLRQQMRARGLGIEQIERSVGSLDPDAMTIGFARRFATYKRATLLLRDLDRLRNLFNNSDRPVQLIVAGKAHPADGPGKELIRQIVKLADESDHLNRIVFIEDYDIEVARRMVQGCDIWLNTPTRGMEASGTSGMKAAMNGVINVSILDGWWDEAFDPAYGFAIGKGESLDNPEEQDVIESRAIYDMLERQILPEFYDRDPAGIPRNWVARMKNCIRELTPRFSTNRMVADYASQYYTRAHALSRRFLRDGLSDARALASQIDRWREQWGGVQIRDVMSDVGPNVPVETPVHVRAVIALGGLTPEEVRVELYHGEVTSMGDLVDGKAIAMRPASPAGANESEHVYVGEFVAGVSGRRGFTVRVMPYDERLDGMLIPGLITWQQGSSTDLDRSGGVRGRGVRPAEEMAAR